MLKTIYDSNVIANSIMQDINEVDARMPLSCEDLYRIDSAILSSLRQTQDFSRELLKKLESGDFESFTSPPKFIQDEFTIIQQEAIMDITLPLQNLFDDMTDYVTQELQGV